MSFKKNNLTENVDILILAAGNIKDKTHFLNYTFNSPGLIPINTGTVASNIIEFYQETIQGCSITLVINELDITEVEEELQYYLKRIRLITVPPTRGINETIKIILNSFNNSHDIIINPVTSIPTEVPKKNEVFLSLSSFQNTDFSLVSLDKDIVNFHTKGNLPLEKAHAFTGIFRTDIEIIKAALEVCSNWTDLLVLVKKIHLTCNLNFKNVNWIDCGHERNFYEAKAKLITSRSFNSIEIITEKGILEKKSTNIKKFKDEINYFSLLPHETQVFFPRIVKSSLTSEFASAKLEYYGYPTMAEYMLYWSLSNAMWEKAFESLANPLKQFQQHQFSIGQNTYISFYICKLQDRLKEFNKQLRKPNKFILKDDYLYINGRKLKNYSLLEKEVYNKLLSLYNENDFCIMHGDYCFNNILYDFKSGIIKLIDARGAFGVNCSGIYGDIKYDLAKLTHSVYGQYDYFIAKLFSFKIVDNEIVYSINKRSNYDLLVYLNQQLIKEIGYQFEDILFLTSLLFLSMPPMHYEDKDRQKALYTHGIVLLNQALGET